MATRTEIPRTDLELRAIAQALILTGGAAPKWLNAELSKKDRFAEDEPKRSAQDESAYRGHMAVALSFGGLLLAFLCCVDLAAEIKFTAPKIAARAAAVDADALEAIAMVQDWQPAGDEKPVLQRLAVTVRNPAYPRAWSAEKTEGDSYLVIFREPAGTPAYAFEVSLESEAVQATPEAVELLTLLRVRETIAREAAESSDSLIARAH